MVCLNIGRDQGHDVLQVVDGKIEGRSCAWRPLQLAMATRCLSASVPQCQKELRVVHLPGLFSASLTFYEA